MDAWISTSGRIPSVDQILKAPAVLNAIARFGPPRVVEAIRHVTASARRMLGAGQAAACDAETIAADARAWLEADARPSVRAVFNLTGTILHTNLGRAVLAEAAIGPKTGLILKVHASNYRIEGFTKAAPAKAIAALARASHVPLRMGERH